MNQQITSLHPSFKDGIQLRKNNRVKISGSLQMGDSCKVIDEQTLIPRLFFKQHHSFLASLSHIEIQSKSI